MRASRDFEYLLSCLSVAEHVPRPDDEEWSALIARISAPGIIAGINEDTFFYFLEVLPPKFQSGDAFAFAEGAEPLHLFWRGGAQFFSRQLTWEETKDFCRLGRVSFPYWY